VHGKLAVVLPKALRLLELELDGVGLGVGVELLVRHGDAGVAVDPYERKLVRVAGVVGIIGVERLVCPSENDAHAVEHAALVYAGRRLV